MNMMSQHPISYMDPNGSIIDTFFTSNQMPTTFGINTTRNDIREKLNSHVKRRIHDYAPMMSTISTTFPSSLSPLSSATSLSPPISFQQMQPAPTFSMPSDPNLLSQMFMFGNSFTPNMPSYDQQLFTNYNNQANITEQDLLRTKPPTPKRLANNSKKRTINSRKPSKCQKSLSGMSGNATMTLNNHNQCVDNGNVAYQTMYGIQDVAMTNNNVQQNYGATITSPASVPLTTTTTTTSEKLSQPKQSNEPDILSLVLSYKKCDLLQDPEIIRFLSSIR